MKISNVLLWIIVIALAGWFLWPKVDGGSFGSVADNNEYFATTTPINGAWTDQLIKNGKGALGSLVVTGAGTTEFVLYDATSTQKWFGGNTSSTQQLAHIPASLAAGTYVFDVYFTDGLFIDVITAGTGTSTVTFR